MTYSDDDDEYEKVENIAFTTTHLLSSRKVRKEAKNVH